jgi:hypothetical protein
MIRHLWMRMKRRISHLAVTPCVLPGCPYPITVLQVLYMYEYFFEYIYTNMYICTYIHLYIEVFVNLYMHGYVYEYGYVCVFPGFPYPSTVFQVNIYIYEHLCMYICIHTYMYVDIDVYRNTYTHVFIPLRCLSWLIRIHINNNLTYINTFINIQ